MELSSDEIAQRIKKLGPSYFPISNQTKAFALDGKTLHAARHNKMETSELFKSLGCTKFQEEKLKREFEDIYEVEDDEEEEPDYSITNHFFISYRQRTEMPLANALYIGIRSLAVNHVFDPTYEEHPRIFFDVRSLKNGEPWEEGFIYGLKGSMLAVPLVSAHPDGGGSVGQMLPIGKEGSDRCDNVLLEWMLSLGLRDAAKLQQPGAKFPLRYIYPVLSGGAPGDNKAYRAFNMQLLEDLSDQPSLATNERFRTMMQEICEGIPGVAVVIEKIAAHSVRDIVKTIINSANPIDLSKIGDTEVNALNACIQLLFEKGSEQYKEHLSEEPEEQEVEEGDE